MTDTVSRRFTMKTTITDTADERRAVVEAQEAARAEHRTEIARLRATVETAAARRQAAERALADARSAEHRAEAERMAASTRHEQHLAKLERRLRDGAPAELAAVIRDVDALAAVARQKVETHLRQGPRNILGRRDVLVSTNARTIEGFLDALARLRDRLVAAAVAPEPIIPEMVEVRTQDRAYRVPSELAGLFQGSCEIDMLPLADTPPGPAREEAWRWQEANAKRWSGEAYQ
jgi:hypothetical protein